MTTVLNLAYTLSAAVSLLSVIVSSFLLYRNIKQPIFLRASLHSVYLSTSPSTKYFIANDNVYYRIKPNPKNISMIYGRNSDAYIQANPSQLTVSASHFCIYWHRGWKIRDLGSTNGTYLNGKLIETQKETRIRVGDTIRVGSTELVLTRSLN